MMTARGSSWQRTERALAGLETAEREVWRSRFENLRTECGCKLGSAVMFAAVGVWSMYLAQGGGYESTWSNIGVGVAALLGGATAGKLLGLLIAHVRLRGLRGALEERTRLVQSPRTKV